MRCTHCEYALWNIRDRVCPECGNPFKPSDFEFTLNSVQFCCPHCRQPYYGTGEKGHLIPPEFNCVSCGQHISMDECVLLPTEGVGEDLTRPDEMPWLERDRRGTFKAWFATIGKAMVSPNRLMDSIPVGGPSGFVFGAITVVIFLLTSILPIFAIVVFTTVGVAGARGGGGAGPVMNAVGGFGVFIAGTLVSAVVAFGLWVLTSHALILLSGGSNFSLKRTSQAMGYSAGAAVLLAVPCVGAYLFYLLIAWWVVSAIIMVARGHRIHGGRAAFAVLTPPMLIVLALAGLITWGIMSIPRGPGGPFAGTTTTSSTPKNSADTISQGILGHTALNNAFPAHPYHITTSLLAADSDFYPLTAPITPPANVPGLPPGTIAARHGDYVFTYFGLNRASSNPALWIFVQAADPAGVPTFPSPGYHVGLLSGEVILIPQGEAFDTALTEQNALRSAAGLPPLPADLPAITGSVPTPSPPP